MKTVKIKTYEGKKLKQIEIRTFSNEKLQRDVITNYFDNGNVQSHRICKGSVPIIINDYDINGYIIYSYKLIKSKTYSFYYYKKGKIKQKIFYDYNGNTDKVVSERYYTNGKKSYICFSNINIPYRTDGKPCQIFYNRDGMMTREVFNGAPITNYRICNTCELPSEIQYTKSKTINYYSPDGRSLYSKKDFLYYLKQRTKKENRK